MSLFCMKIQAQKHSIQIELLVTMVISGSMVANVILKHSSISYSNG